jgi:hypothetical protein
MPFRVKRGARFWCCQAPVFSSVRGARVRTGPTGSRQAAAATGAHPAHGRPLRNPRVTRRAGYGAAPPIADVWSRTARGDEGIPAADHCAPGLDTGSTSFVLAALRALHVDRAFTAGALLRYRGNAEMCWDA